MALLDSIRNAPSAMSHQAVEQLHRAQDAFDHAQTAIMKPKDLPLVSDAIHFLKNQAIYMSTRGFVSFALVTALPAFGIVTGATLGMFIAVPVTAGLLAYKTYRDEKHANDRLVQAYRDEIATKLGIEPASVTREHLLEVANGDRDKRLPANRVLQEALEKDSQKHVSQYLTTVASSVALVAMLLTFGGVEALGTIVQSIAGFFGHVPTTEIAQLMGVMTASGLGLGTINNVADKVTEHLFGLNEPTAHDLVQGIKRDVMRGRHITEERVFGVYVAADKILKHVVEETYGASYTRLPAALQTKATKQFGGYYPLKELTSDINHGQVQPDELAFTAVGQSSGIERLPNPVLPAQRKQKGLWDEALEVAHGISQKASEALWAEEKAEGHSHHHAHSHKSFVERYGHKHGHQRELTFAEQEVQREADKQPTGPTVH